MTNRLIAALAVAVSIAVNFAHAGVQTNANEKAEYSFYDLSIAGVSCGDVLDRKELDGCVTRVEGVSFYGLDGYASIHTPRCDGHVTDLDFCHRCATDEESFKVMMETYEKIRADFQKNYRADIGEKTRRYSWDSTNVCSRSMNVYDTFGHELIFTLRRSEKANPRVFIRICR